jgi:two-component system NtrC family response regulator
MHLLLGHSWPGNVRELENCLTRAVVMTTGSVIRPEHLGLEVSPSGPTRVTSLDQAERAHVAGVLRTTGGHKSRAAEILEISRPRLDRLIEKHGLADLVGKTRNQTDES